MKLDLKLLSPKQRDAWVMRYRYGWRLKKIALRLGTSHQAVSAILRRAQLRAGATEAHRITAFPTRGRRVRAVSLSDVFNY
jgi:DNA-directed RNA polymerase specialized sigma24 family protein